MSLAELRLQCTAAGLPTSGTKPTLIARLQEVAAQSLSEDHETVVVAEQTEKSEPEPVAPKPVEAKPEPVKNVSPVVVPVAGVLPPANHAKHVSDVLDAVKARHPYLNFSYDQHQEVFLIDGGKQGRVTLTARQPAKPILLACDGYVSINQRGAKNNDEVV